MKPIIAPIKTITDEIEYTDTYPECAHQNNNNADANAIAVFNFVI
jgi:hypothetical protein